MNSDKKTKSFVCEGKNLENAIKKAMLLAKNPQVFIIKILEKGNSSFFWWKNTPCKIAFTYEIKDNFENENKRNIQNNRNQNIKNENNFKKEKINNNYNSNIRNENKENLFRNNRNEFDNRRNFDRSQNNYQKEQFENNRLNNFEKDFRQNKKNQIDDFGDIFNSSEKNLRKQKILNNNLNNNINNNNNNFEKNNNVPNFKKNSNQNENNFDFEIKKDITENWNPEHIEFIKNWINFTIESFNISTEKANFSIDKNVLTVNIINTFKNLNNSDEINEKHLLSSIVVLLYESLKKKFKNFNSRAFKITLIYK